MAPRPSGGASIVSRKYEPPRGRGPHYPIPAPTPPDFLIIPEHGVGITFEESAIVFQLSMISNISPARTRSNSRCTVGVSFRRRTPPLRARARRQPLRPRQARSPSTVLARAHLAYCKSVRSYLLPMKRLSRRSCTFRRNHGD